MTATDLFYRLKALRSIAFADECGVVLLVSGKWIVASASRDVTIQQFLGDHDLNPYIRRAMLDRCGIPYDTESSEHEGA